MRGDVELAPCPTHQSPARRRRAAYLFTDLALIKDLLRTTRIVAMGHGEMYLAQVEQSPLSRAFSTKGPTHDVEKPSPQQSSFTTV